MWSELESTVNSIEHAPESVDLADVRALLRRTQDYIEGLEELLEASTVPGDVALRIMRALSE